MVSDNLTDKVPYTDMKLSLNDKDGSLCLKQLHNVVYAKHLPLVLGT